MTSSRPLVKKNRKEYKFFHFDDTAMSNILQELQYRRLQQYCYHCSKQANQNNSFTCHLCQRSIHKQCKDLRNLHNSQLCRFCTTYTCLKCNITFFEYQRKVKCSICLKYLHIQCWNMPFQLNQHMKKFQNYLYHKIEGFNRIVCQQCQKQWAIDSQIMMSVNTQSQKYFLVKVNHPSPIHYTWLKDSQYNLIRQANIQQEVVLVQNKKPKIENIFSIHLIQKYSTLGLGCIYTLLKQIKIQSDIYNDKAYFLVKWQDRDLLVWQTLQTVRPFEEHLRNFFIQLNLNWMKVKQIQQQEVNLFLQNLIFDESVHKKANFLGNKIINQDKIEEESNTNLLQKVYDIYSNQKKQSLLTQEGKDDSNKISLLCSLINTILFAKKQLRPIFFFTSRNNIKSWYNNLTKQCPFHKCLMVTGLEQNLQILMNNHFYSLRHKHIFYNSIYLFDYNSFQAILSFFRFKQVIKSPTLVIMEDKISFLANNFYDACEVAKIKLKNKTLQNGLGLQIQSLSEKTNISSQSALNSRNQKSYFEYFNSGLKARKEQLSSKYQNNQLFSECLLIELQRLSFLRFIMLFGLQFQNTQAFIKQLLQFDKTTFSTENEAQTSLKIQSYIKMFLTVLHSNLRTKQLPQQIVKFCCFDIEPCEIFERITLINKIKTTLKRNRKEFKLIKPQKKKQAFPTSLEFHLMVFEAVLIKGFGKWQLICEFSRVWEEGTAKMSLRQYFNLKTGLIIKLSAFCQLVKDLLIKFWTAIKMNNHFI